VIEKIPEI